MGELLVGWLLHVGCAHADWLANVLDLVMRIVLIVAFALQNN
jgi:hypothetical protein